MVPGGENTGILLCPRPGPSTWEVYQEVLVGLQYLIPLVSPFQDEISTVSPCVDPCHWGVSGLAFGSEAL